MTRTPRARLSAVAATAALLVAGCAGSESGATGSEGAAGAAAADWSERGPITLVIGKDTSGKLPQLLESWNAEHPEEQVTLVELPESSAEQRTQLIQNAQLQSEEYSVLGLDVVWTAEFAANSWITELPEDQLDLEPFLDSTVETATYYGSLYTVPHETNGNLLYYRTDALEAAGISEPPTTFEEMWAACDAVAAVPEFADLDCYAGQFFSYEGLTVNTTQAIASAGGALFDDEGAPIAESPEARAGLQTLVDGFEQGYIPRSALSYKEEEARQAFQDGGYVFMNNWPYVYLIASQTDGSSAVAENFDVAPLPGIGDHPGRTVLGGLNLGVSAYADNKGTALDFIQFLTSEEIQKEWSLATGRGPVIEALYDDPDFVAAYPYAPILKESVLAGTGRPMVVNYGDVTLAIQQEATAALQGEKDVETATSDLQTQLESLQQ